MKLKLNIQKFSSTNATTHYELSQYIGTDKPTYLVDYNGDMNKIDTAIYGADSQATQNANNIGTMSNLNTTEKSSLVGAINEVNTQVGTNTNNISTNTSNIGTLGTNQGVMANLTTTEKSSLVGAINEVDAENGTQNTNISKNANDIQTLNTQVQKFNLTSFTTYGVNDITVTNGSKSECSLTLATNSDGSIFKLYGNIAVVKSGSSTSGKITLATSLRPETDITINGAGFRNSNNGSQVSRVFPMTSFTVKTNGNIEITWSVFGSDTNANVMLFACLYFLKDFGDVNPPE